MRAAVKPKIPEELSQSFVFEYRSENVQKTLMDFLKFVQNTAPGMDGLRAQYLVAELFIQREDFKEASQILQKLAAVALDDELFNVSVLEKLADCYLHMGLFPQAAQAYTTVGNSGVKAMVPEALLGQSVTSLAQGDKEQAYLRFQELVAFYPTYKNQKQLMLPMGVILWENGKHPEALEYFLRNADNPACLYFAALCQRSIDKQIEAMSTFKKVIQRYPQTVWAKRAKYELGETFYQQHDYPLASRHFTGIVKESPRDLWQTLALYRVACSDVQMKRYKEAENKLWPLQRTEKNHPLHPNITYLLTESLAEQNKIDDVVRLLKEETKGKTQTPDGQYRLIWSLSAIGQYPEAIKLSNEFLKKEWDAELTPKTLVVQGYAYDKMKLYPESVASYQLVVDNFPQTPYASRALQMMAITYYRSKQYIPIVTQINHQWNALSADVRKKHPETLFWIAEAHLRLQNGKEARDYYQKFIDAAPPDHALVTQALLGQAVSYAVDKDFPTAVLTLQRTFQAAQEKNNKALMAAVMLEMGNVYFNAKDYENAASSYRSFQRIDPKHPRMAFALYQEGLSLHRAEYYSDAVAAWGKLVKTYPKDPMAVEGLFRKAKTQFDLGKYPEAIKDYDSLARSYPQTELAKDARLQIAQCYYNAGDFAKAILHYTDFLNRFPNDKQVPDVLALLQTCYYQAKKTPEEIEKLTKDQPKSPVLADIYWEEGAKQYNDKNYDKARDYFQKILLDFPSSSLAPQAAFYRAESLYLQEKFAEAIPAYQNFIQYYPEDSQRSLAMFHLSVGLFNEKSYALSAQAFQDFAKSFPDDPMAKNASLNVAVCYAKAQDVDNAVAAYQNYLNLYPGGEDAGATYLQMGQLLEKFAQEKRAVDVYRKVPRNLPEYPEALFSAGRCYRALSDPEGEKEVYEELMNYPTKNDPYRIAGLLQLGEIYAAKDEAKAIRLYQDVAENAADPESKTAAQARRQALESQKK